MDDETQTPGTPAPVTTDTAGTQTSEADVQTNIDAPEAGQDTKETDLTATDTAGEKLYAGKYKTAEDMEKAYTELQSKATKDSQEKADLTRILNEAFATPETTTVTDTASMVEEETTPQNTGNDQISRDMAVLKFIVGHQEADGETMKKILAEDPMIKQISGHDAKLEYAYLRSQSIAAPKAIEEAKKSAQDATQAKNAEKTAAQVETAKTSEPIGEVSLMEKATGNYSQAERDEARQALIKKHLINL